jgi:hypothetical protein
LPAALLIVVELTEIGDDLLPGPRRGTHTLDQGIVAVGLAVFVAGVAAQEHTSLPITQDDQGRA